ncbi:MAG: DUF3592 domain-containing protein [Treponema sp.]|jgi:hypothetical protein|nr:DUF3592 domain-containing protein [Treponema sp.]
MSEAESAMTVGFNFVYLIHIIMIIVFAASVYLLIAYMNLWKTGDDRFKNGRRCRYVLVFLLLMGMLVLIADLTLYCLEYLGVDAAFSGMAIQYNGQLIFLLHVFFPLVGIILIILSVVRRLQDARIMNEGLAVDAVVCGVRKTGSGEDEEIHNTIGYSVNGKNYYKEKTRNAYGPEYSIGQTIKIYCHKDNPQKIVIPGDFSANSVGDVFLTLCGLCMIYVALYVPWGK